MPRRDGARVRPTTHTGSHHRQQCNT